MSEVDLPRKLLAETLGTAFLLATVVGSGVMAAKLAGGNIALALLGNTIPTGAILAVLILIFGPTLGAHLNPAVSLAMALRGQLSMRDLAPYVGAQILGAVLRVWAAHLMFDLPIWQLSTTARFGKGQWLAEFVATFGLLLAIFWVCRAQQFGNALRGRALHHRGLLVYRLDILCESRGDAHSRSLGHVCRNCTVQRSSVRRRSTTWDGCRRHAERMDLANGRAHRCARIEHLVARRAAGRGKCRRVAQH
jgi:hypothetical protein